MIRRARFRLPRPFQTAPLFATALLLASVAMAAAQFFPDREPTNDEITFGCQPGPVEEFHHSDPPVPPRAVGRADAPMQEAELSVQMGGGHHVDGHGFNMEHTLWSCPAFRRVLSREILTAFQPDIARVDSGQLPFAPEDLSASELNRGVYQALMNDPKYQPGWSMLRRLNKENVRLMLGVWGGPGQFTDDGTRRGQLLPQYADQYVEYVTSVVDYLVRQQHVAIWAVTVANEPDGGDGTSIDPDLYVSIARQLGPRLAPYDVKLYGPDTASAANAMPYIERMVEDPEALRWFGAVATHEYFTDNAVAELISTVHATDPTLPVYVTEYTSFQYGALDRGQEARNEIGQMLESLQVYASVMNAGADAAIYWDAVDYYQAGHAAVTRWGLLQGPDEAFAPRTRYSGFLQILPYVQAGSEILQTNLSGPDRLAVLAVGGGSRRPGDLMVAAINRAGPIQLTITFDGTPPEQFDVWVTDPDDEFEHIGRVRVVEGRALVTLPARSVTTLTVGPPPDEEE
jgi:O-glycosyl hydrolase